MTEFLGRRGILIRGGLLYLYSYGHEEDVHPHITRLCLMQYYCTIWWRRQSGALPFSFYYLHHMHDVCHIHDKHDIDTCTKSEKVVLKDSRYR